MSSVHDGRNVPSRNGRTIEDVLDMASAPSYNRSDADETAA